MEYYSAIKWNKIGSFVVMWMDLESVIQSEEKRLNKVPKQGIYITYKGRRHLPVLPKERRH